MGFTGQLADTLGHIFAKFGHRDSHSCLHPVLGGITKEILGNVNAGRGKCHCRFPETFGGVLWCKSRGVYSIYRVPPASHVHQGKVALTISKNVFSVYSNVMKIIPGNKTPVHVRKLTPLHVRSPSSVYLQPMYTGTSPAQTRRNMWRITRRVNVQWYSFMHHSVSATPASRRWRKPSKRYLKSLSLFEATRTTS